MAWRPRGVLLVILALAALVRFVPLGLTGTRFHHLDEWDFALSARQMVTEGDLNPHRFHHPALYRYAIALVYPVVDVVLGPLMAPEARGWTPYIAGRLISAALGVAGVWLVFRLGLRLMPLGGAALAAGVLALMPLHVKFSHIAKPDVTMAMWVALTTLLAWRIAEKPSRRLYVLAGLCVGFAASSKYNGIVACVTIFFAHMVAPGERGWLRRLAGANLWLAALCSGAGFVATSPYHVLDFGNVRREFATGYAFVVSGKEEEAAQRAPALVEFGGKAAFWVGAVPLALAVGGGVWWWYTRRRALFVVGSVVVAYGLLISGWAFRQAHYLMPIVPAVATLTAVPVVRLWLRRRRLALALAVAALAPGAVVSLREVVRFWRPDTRVLAKEWMVTHLRGRHGMILRDYDALWDTAKEVLPIKNPGFDFYEKADREYLNRGGITHFVLSDSVASTEGMPPARAEVQRAAREALLACGERLVRFPPGWWREGPGIEVYEVKGSLLREFEADRERRVRDLVGKVAAVENELARHPDDAALHMEAGRVLCRLAGISRPGKAAEAWRRAERHFQDAARADATLADAHYDLGCVYLRVGTWLAGPQHNEQAAIRTFGRAVGAFRKAIEVDPKQADYYFTLGYALWCWMSDDIATLEARQAEGRRMYHTAAELDPTLTPPKPHILAIIERGPRPLR